MSANTTTLPAPASVAVNGQYPTCDCCFEMVSRTYRDSNGSLVCKSCYVI